MTEAQESRGEPVTLDLREGARELISALLIRRVSKTQVTACVDADAESVISILQSGTELCSCFRGLRQLSLNLLPLIKASLKFLHSGENFSQPQRDGRWGYP